MKNKFNPQGSINPFVGRNGKAYKPLFSGCGCVDHNCSCQGGPNPVLKAQQ